MLTKQYLIAETNNFFELFWKPVNGQPPQWSEPWYFDGSIPNKDKRGCYVLFREKEIIYIGVGLGKSFGQYQGSGLGDRLKRYWKVDKNKSGKKYKPTEDWNELTSIMTIGFNEENYPLAAALEIYLINKLNPSRNLQHK